MASGCWITIKIRRGVALEEVEAVDDIELLTSLTHSISPTRSR